jgi:hypothetical protein
MPRVVFPAPRRSPPASDKVPVRACQACGRPILPARSSRRYCSWACTEAGRRSPTEKFDKLAAHHNNLPLPQLDGFVGRADPYLTLLEARGLAIDADGHILRKAPHLSPGATKVMDTARTLEEGAGTTEDAKPGDVRSDSTRQSALLYRPGFRG